MRVALLSANAPRHNAIGNQIAEKVRFFQERGAEVRLFVQDGRVLHPGVTSCAVELTAPTAEGPAWEFLQQADLVIAVYAQYYDLLQLLPRLFGTGPRIVFDYHGVTPLDLWHDPHSEGLRESLRQRGYVWCADHALTTSHANALELHAATLFPGEHTTTLPLCVDVDRFAPAPNDFFLQERLGIDGRFLLYVGRLAGNKRVPLLIDALARLDERTIHAVIVGDCSDVYADEAARCRALAQQLGVADRVHWLGQLDDAELPRAYRSADVLVMPSLHEGFCVPVLEAMASGLPVVASRSAALPETIGDAGLTFTPNDADDLARQLRRVLSIPVGPDIPVWPGRQECLPHERPRRIAVVSFRFGPDIVGGAETSLRTMAKALQDAGHHVEVFTTCTTTESHWQNDVPPGSVMLEGLQVHRFPIDPHDAAAHGESVRAILDSNGNVTLEAEERYLEGSIHSTGLVETLARRRDEFDAIITGPYLFGLTADIAARFPEQTIVVPCFHEEPLARLAVWPWLFGTVGGILYHSAEERALAQARLGVNHPNAHEIGAVLPPRSASADRSENAGRPYVVYCGRYSEEKNMPLLLEWARQYQQENPERLAFVFLGRGEVKLPSQPWLRDLGFVSDSVKGNVLAGATALVQLSTQESLSLVALEAWAEGTPVIVHRDCAVLAGQIERSQGGVAVGDYVAFAAALNLLRADEEARREIGRRGQAYVEENYSSQKEYVDTLIAAIDALTKPIRLQMRERGLERARQFARPVWQQRFAEFVENLLTRPARFGRDDVHIEPLRSSLEAAAGTRTLLLPIRLIQRGTRASAPTGAGCTRVCCEVQDDTGCVIVERSEMQLPALLVPGQPQVAALPIPLPAEAGAYRVVLWPERIGGDAPMPIHCPKVALTMADRCARRPAGCAADFLDTVEATLPKAHQLQQLPADYVDVTEGALAPVKRLLKKKLLNNFKHSYVDVLSRQQSQVNGHLVLMIQQLTECCAMLDHAVAGMNQRIDALEGKMEQALVTLSERPAHCER